jgi:hypothetical protein
MSKRTVTKDDLKAFAAEGWTFRKKMRKGIQYISRRKGTKEHGLGRYSDEVWTLIEDVTQNSTDSDESTKEPVKTQIKPDEKFDPFIKSLEEIKSDIIRHKMIRCLHIDADGFCEYWRMEKPTKYAEELNERELKVLFKKLKGPGDRAPVWLVMSNAVVCEVCAAFIDEVMLTFLNSQIKHNQ